MKIAPPFYEALFNKNSDEFNAIFILFIIKQVPEVAVLLIQL